MNAVTTPAAGRSARAVSPTVSVIVPCYNTERYLGAALESACSQVPPPFEVIVIDDGSSDGSASIAERHGPLVQCHRHPHRGAAATRNAGLALASGDTIAFLDADDLWPAGSLQCRLDVLVAHPEIACATGLTEQFISPELPEEIRRSYVCPSGTSRGRGPGVLLVRTEAADRVGRFDETLRVGEAIDWIDRADAAGVTMHIVEQVVLRRRIHGDNTGARDHHQRADYLRMLKNSLDRRRAAGKGDSIASPDGERG